MAPRSQQETIYFVCCILESSDTFFRRPVTCFFSSSLWSCSLLCFLMLLYSSLSPPCSSMPLPLWCCHSQRREGWVPQRLQALLVNWLIRSTEEWDWDGRTLPTKDQHCRLIGGIVTTLVFLFLLHAMCSAAKSLVIRSQGNLKCLYFLIFCSWRIQCIYNAIKYCTIISVQNVKIKNKRSSQPDNRSNRINEP